MDQVAGPLTLSATAIAAVLVANGVWAVWEEGFNTDATLRLGLGFVACLIAILLILRLAL
jgi:glucose dehydrogenase